MASGWVWCYRPVIADHGRSRQKHQGCVRPYLRNKQKMRVAGWLREKEFQFPYNPTEAKISSFSQIRWKVCRSAEKRWNEGGLAG